MKRFLRKHRVEGIVATDRSRSLFKAMGVSRLPHVALIDPKGIVRDVGNTDLLTDEKIASLLHPNTSEVKSAFTKEETSGSKGIWKGGAPLLQIMVAESDGSDTMISSSRNSFKGIGIGVEDMLMNLYRLSRARIIQEKPLPSGKYDINLNFARQASLPDSLLQQVLEGAFGIKLAFERRSMDVYELVEGQDPVRQLADVDKGKRGYRVRPGHFYGVELSCAEVAKGLESAIGEIVVSSPDAKGVYDIEIEWNAEDKNAAIDALQARTGLMVKPARREVDVLVIR